MNIDFWFCKFSRTSPKSEHGCGFRSNLHEADFSNAAYNARVVPTFYVYDRFGDVWRKTGFCRLPLNDCSDGGNGFGMNDCA